MVNTRQAEETIDAIFLRSVIRCFRRAYVLHEDVVLEWVLWLVFANGFVDGKDHAKSYCIEALDKHK